MAARRRAGFALIVVVVSLAVLLILATVVLSNTAGGRQRDRVQNAVTALRRFQSELGAQTQQPSYFGDVKLYPRRLSYLYAKISTTDSTSCRVPYATSDANKWIGPYHLISMVRDKQYQIEPGIILDDTLARIPPSGPSNQAAILAMVMNGVALQDAQDMGMALDGKTDGSGPIVTFTASGSNPVTVRYNINIVGC